MKAAYPSARKPDHNANDTFHILSEAKPQTVSPGSNKSMSISSPESPDERSNNHKTPQEHKTTPTEANKTAISKVEYKNAIKPTFSPPSNSNTPNMQVRFKKTQSEVNFGPKKLDSKGPKSIKSQIDDKLQ